MKYFYLLTILLILNSCTSIKQYNAAIEAPIAAEKLHKDTDKAYRKLKKLHPLLYQYISKNELDRKFDSLKQTINKPLTSKQFYDKITPVIAEVKQGHISVIPALKLYNNKTIKAFKKKKFEINDLDFEYLDNTIIVKNTQSKDSSIVGSEVLKFNDIPVADLLQKYKTQIASDGYNNTFHNKFIATRFNRFYFYDKGRQDSLQLTLRKNDSVYTKMFRRVLKQKKKDSTSQNIKKKKPVKLTRAEKKDRKRKAKAKRKFNDKYGYIKSRKHYTRNFKFLDDGRSIGYLKIRSFTNGKYKDFYQESFAKLALERSKYLIIDLRDNTGGRIAEINNLYSYLTDKPYQFIAPSEVNSHIPFLKFALSEHNPLIMKVVGVVGAPIIALHNLFKVKKKDGKLFYKFKYSKTQDPNKLNFKGDIYVLINGVSFSASSILSTNLQANKRAIFVGEETGGAYNGTVAGVFKGITLPNSKIKMRIGLLQIEAPYKQNPDGYGIKPDVEILPTVKDRQHQIDPEIQWVLSDVKRKISE